MCTYVYVYTWIPFPIRPAMQKKRGAGCHRRPQRIGNLHSGYPFERPFGKDDFYVVFESLPFDITIEGKIRPQPPGHSRGQRLANSQKATQWIPGSPARHKDKRRYAEQPSRRGGLLGSDTRAGACHPRQRQRKHYGFSIRYLHDSVFFSNKRATG